MIRIRTNWNNGLLLKVSSITHSIVISTSDDLTGAGVLLKVAFDALIYWKYWSSNILFILWHNPTYIKLTNIAAVWTFFGIINTTKLHYV